MASVISKALKITGQLESTEDIQIDGEIEGDVRGVGVKIGQNAKVKGTVYGEDVELERHYFFPSNASAYTFTTVCTHRLARRGIISRAAG